jgi:hypothetical protein
MNYNRDKWNQKKAYVMELYLQGKSPAIISGLTGVPRIRIERELNRLTERRPELLSTHLAAQYPSRRKLLTDVDPAVLSPDEIAAKLDYLNDPAPAPLQFPLDEDGFSLGQGLLEDDGYDPAMEAMERKDEDRWSK